jgi:hypothetical protein
MEQAGQQSRTGAGVKAQRDGPFQGGCRLKVAALPLRREGRGGYGPGGSPARGPQKSFAIFPLPEPPVPQTDTGGWVEYTQARE